MSCERNTKPLADVAAGRAPSPGLQAHLDGCPACRAELALLREALGLADGALRGLASAEPAPELQARIRQAAASEALDLRPGWSAARWALAAGCAVLVVAVLVAGWSSRWLAGGPRTATATPRPQPSVATAAPSVASPGPVVADRAPSGRSSPEFRSTASSRRPATAGDRSPPRQTVP